MLVALGAFAGLRPSEACNVRREDMAESSLSGKEQNPKYNN